MVHGDERMWAAVQNPWRCLGYVELLVIGRIKDIAGRHNSREMVLSHHTLGCPIIFHHRTQGEESHYRFKSSGWRGEVYVAWVTECHEEQGSWSWSDAAIPLVAMVDASFTVAELRMAEVKWRKRSLSPSQTYQAQGLESYCRITNFWDLWGTFAPPPSLFYRLAVWIISLSPALLLLKLLKSGSCPVSPLETKVAHGRSYLAIQRLVRDQWLQVFFPALI